MAVPYKVQSKAQTGFPVVHEQLYIDLRAAVGVEVVVVFVIIELLLLLLLEVRS